MVGRVGFSALKFNPRVREGGLFFGAHSLEMCEVAERFGLGASEREASMTRQMPYEPLPASVLFARCGGSVNRCKEGIMLERPQVAFKYLQNKSHINQGIDSRHQRGMETRSVHNDSSDNYHKKNEANTRPFQLAHHSSDDEQNYQCNQCEHNLGGVEGGGPVLGERLSCADRWGGGERGNGMAAWSYGKNGRHSSPVGWHQRLVRPLITGGFSNHCGGV